MTVAVGVAGVNIRGIVHYGYGDLYPETTTAQVASDLLALSTMQISIVRVFVANHSIVHADCASRLRSFLDTAVSSNVKVIASLIDLYNTGCNPKGTDSFYQPSGGFTTLTPAFFASGYTDDYTAFVTAVVTACAGHAGLYAWEVGNELKDDSSSSAFTAFLQAVATQIKGIDPVTPVSSGMLNAAHTGITPDALYGGTPAIDIVTVHAYNADRSGAADVTWAVANGKRAIVEEFGIAGVADRSGVTAGELLYWTGLGATGFLQWGFVAKAVPDNGDGDTLYGWDTFVHAADYTQLGLVYGQPLPGLVPDGPPAVIPQEWVTVFETTGDGPLPGLGTSGWFAGMDPFALDHGSGRAPVAYYFPIGFVATPEGSYLWRFTITYEGPQPNVMLDGNATVYSPQWYASLSLIMGPGMMDPPGLISTSMPPPEPSVCTTTAVWPDGGWAVGERQEWNYSTTYVDEQGSESFPSANRMVIIYVAGPNTVTIAAPSPHPGAVGWFLNMEPPPTFGTTTYEQQRYQTDGIPSSFETNIVLNGPDMTALATDLRACSPRVGWNPINDPGQQLIAMGSTDTTVPQLRVGESWSRQMNFGAIDWGLDNMNGVWRPFDPARYGIRAQLWLGPSVQQTSYGNGNLAIDNSQQQVVDTVFPAVVDDDFECFPDETYPTWGGNVPTGPAHYSLPLPAGANSFRITVTTALSSPTAPPGSDHDAVFDQTFCVGAGIVVGSGYTDGAVPVGLTNGLNAERLYTGIFGGDMYQYTLPVVFDWPMAAAVLAQSAGGAPWYREVTGGDVVAFYWIGGLGNFRTLTPAHITIEPLKVHLVQTHQFRFKAEAMAYAQDPWIPPPPVIVPTFLKGGNRGLQYA